MPLDRDLEFIIDFIPGTAPVAKRPYRMPANELEELKRQLRELQDKGYIGAVPGMKSRMELLSNGV
jgi:hypothetical protein